MRSARTAVSCTKAPSALTRAQSAGRTAQRQAERKECPVHCFQRHGKEAEELRKGVEALIKAAHLDEDRDDYRVAQAVNELCDDLESLLDRVDARDSLAYLERSKG